MRKAKDDRVKIATHHFRISIEEEGDEENKEAEDAARETDRRFSITIEADSGTVVASQESQAQDLPIDKEERSFANDKTANEILSEEFVERTWNEQEKKAQSFGSTSSKNSGDSKGRSSKGSVGQQQILLEKFVDRTLNEQGREAQVFEFKTSKDSDGSYSGPSQKIGSRESISQKKRIDKFANDENLSDDSQNCGKIEKTQSDNLESETRFSVASSEVPNENYEISASGSSPFGVLCSKFKYIINESSYENVDLTKKLERGSTSSFLPFETSNPSELKRHRSLSSYETYKSSGLNTFMQRKRSLQDPTGVTLQNLQLLDQPRERAQSMTTAEIQETSQILTHPNIESIKAVPPSAVSVSPLLIRRYYKVMSAFSNNSSSLENTYPSKMLEDPLQTRQDSIKSSKNDVNCTNSKEEGNQRNTQRRLTLPAMNIDLDSGEKTGTANYQNVLSGTSVNPIRRSSIANAAICSSLAPSLASAYPGVPNCLLPTSNENEQSNISSISEQIPERSGVTGLKMKLPFLRLHIPASQPISGEEGGEEEDANHHSHYHHHHHHHHHVFPYFHVPTFTFTAPATDGEPGRKFNFGIRRHSQTVSRCLRSPFYSGFLFECFY